MNNKISQNISALRGIGAICIVIYHYACIYSEKIGGGYGIKYKFFDFGWLTYAVPMFFILSAMFLYKKARELNDVIQLLVYRMTRLYPAYWMGVLLSFFIRRFLIKDGISLKALFFNLTMLEDVFGISAIDGVYWTMAYELMLLFVLLCIIMIGKIPFVKIHFSKRLIDNTDLICSVWLWLGIVSQLFMKITGHTSSSIKCILFASSYLSLFVMGMIFCDVYMFHSKMKLWKIVNIIVALIYEIVFMPFATAGIAIFASLLVFIVVSGKVEEHKLFSSPILIYLGSISYSIYLCHRQMGEFWASLAVGENKYILGVLLMAVSFVLSLVFAIIASKFEKSILSFVKNSKIYKFVFR